jgi:hypothetical protein
MDITRVKKEIWKAVEDLNRAWTVENDAKKLGRYFHQNMVAIAPNERLRIEGGKKCVAAWMGFTKMAKIHWWKTQKPKIQVYGNEKMAVVTYYYDMSVEMGGKTVGLSGRDMLCLIKEGRMWKVVAVQFSPYPG